MNAHIPTIVLAAGGTGGHMFPAEALARELTERNRAVALITDKRGAGFGAGLEGIAVHRISADQIGGGLAGKIKGALAMIKGWLQARRLLTQIRPAAAVGFGGYPSIPTMFAATRAGIPTVIHEQNAVLGRANAALAGRVSAIATSFGAVASIRPQDEYKVRRTGNPVREAAAAAAATRYPDPAANDGEIVLAIIGGSQGARALSDIVPPAIGLLPDGLRARLRIVQQARPEDVDRVVEAYRALSVEAEIKTFFDDLPSRMAGASLLITRAGASTITELTAIGRPAILIPYPFAADDHQRHNALEIERAGGAWMMVESELSPETLARRLQDSLSEPGVLSQAAEAARSWSIPDAASRLADQVDALIETRAGATT